MGVAPDLGKTAEALIALGGNLGDVRAAFRHARESLNANKCVEILAVSLIYRSPPMGPPDQPDYLNAVMAVSTSLLPLPLLRLLQSIEADNGRTRTGERWGARTLDLDLLAVGRARIQSAELTLPHPGIAERMFVLQPLCDIRPAWQHPCTGKSARRMMRELQAQGCALSGKGEAW